MKNSSTIILNRIKLLSKSSAAVDIAARNELEVVLDLILKLPQPVYKSIPSYKLIGTKTGVVISISELIIIVFTDLIPISDDTLMVKGNSVTERLINACNVNCNSREFGLFDGEFIYVFDDKSRLTVNIY